jgi:hypothetical protein
VIVPLEADAIMLPSLPFSNPRKSVLSRIRSALQAGALDDAYKIGDEYLIENGWTREILADLHGQAIALRSWREER